MLKRRTAGTRFTCRHVRAVTALSKLQTLTVLSSLLPSPSQQHQCLMTSRGHNNTACPLCRHTLAPGLTPLVAKAAATAAAAAEAAPESVEAVPESVELSAVRSAELQLAIDAAMDGDLSF